MNLQTQIPLSQKEPQIDYQSKVLLLGSCFTENMGGKLDYFQFQNTQNPFGIIFNPVSISTLVLRALNDNLFSDKDVFQHNGLWHCFETHSSLSFIDKDEILKELNVQLKEFKKNLIEASHVILTLGSAWVYKFHDSQEIVANCHKVSQSAFNKELLSIETILVSLESIVSEIKKVNSKVTFIFTVSPVRHIKDGFVENAKSKAHLIAGLHKTISVLSQAKLRGLHYFPSYELVMDELRDYRFYKEDMLHLNNTAIQYIWEKFKQVWVCSKTEILQKKIDTVQKGLCHKPFNSMGEDYTLFKKHLQQTIKDLQKELPWAVFK